MSSRVAARSATGGLEPSTWMLQADAASAAGCSVSVIRKWRRAGAIAERTRTSSGGMKRIEVRLSDVLAKMQDSMPGRTRTADTPLPVSSLSQPQASEEPRADPDVRAATPEAGLRPAELEVFVRHIAEAERRAAAAEAQLEANEVMLALLRERVAALQSELESATRTTSPSNNGTGGRHLEGLVSAIREFRAGVEDLERNGVRHDAQQRVRARHTYDAALLSLCAAAGVATRFKLGASLTPTDRNRLAKALAEAGLDILP